MLTLLLGMLVLAGVGAVGWLLVVYPKQPGPGRGREVAVKLPEHVTVNELAEQLADKQLVRRPLLWSTYARMIGAHKKLNSGAVRVTDNMSPKQLAARLSRGFGRTLVRVTIPEGFSQYDIALRLAAWGICSDEEFLAAASDPALLRKYGMEGASFEGYLFPDTYELWDDASPQHVVEQMAHTWQRKAEPIFGRHSEQLERFQQQLGWGVPEVVTLASIVEKEAAVALERATIAGVFLNRLMSETFRPQRLQADPTVAYGCQAQGAQLASCRHAPEGVITREMLSDADNLYNTYRREGLPPGPICNPGLGALRAVLAPEEHSYLYFVARGGGRHRFSKTLEEHNAAVEQFLKP